MSPVRAARPRADQAISSLVEEQGLTALLNLDSYVASTQAQAPQVQAPPALKPPVLEPAKELVDAQVLPPPTPRAASPAVAAELVQSVAPAAPEPKPPEPNPPEPNPPAQIAPEWPKVIEAAPQVVQADAVPMLPSAPAVSEVVVAPAATLVPIAPPTWAVPQAGSFSGLGRIGPYELLSEVHQDSVGVYYAARDSEQNLDVLVTLLDFQSGARDRDVVVADLQHSVLAAAAIEHPGLGRIHDAGVMGEGVYIAYREVAGHTLSQALMSGWKLRPRAAATLVRALGVAIAQAHSQGVVHAGINPSSVMLASEGRPIMLGLGCAALGRAADLPAMDPLISSATAYLAPEQLQGGEVDARTDVHALGLLLYELLTGRRAYPGDTVAEISRSMVAHDPAPPHWMRPDIPERLSAIAMQAIQRNPVARYERVADMLAAFNAWFEETASEALEDEQVITAQDAAPASSKPRWLWAGAGLLAAAALAWGVLGGDKRPPRPEYPLTPTAVTVQPAAEGSVTEAVAPVVAPMVAPVVALPPGVAPAAIDGPSAGTPAALTSVAAGTVTAASAAVAGVIPPERGAAIGSTAAGPSAVAAATPATPPVVSDAPAPAQAVSAAPTATNNAPTPPLPVSEIVILKGKVDSTSRPVVRAVPPARITQTEIRQAKPAVSTRVATAVPAAVATAVPVALPAVVPAASTSGVVQLAVSPWAQVEVNGQVTGVSPPLSRLSLKEGQHVITLRNQDFAPYVTTIQVTADKVTTIRHRFE